MLLKNGYKKCVVWSICGMVPPTKFHQRADARDTACDTRGRKSGPGRRRARFHGDYTPHGVYGEMLCGVSSSIVVIRKQNRCERE